MLKKDSSSLRKVAYGEINENRYNPRELFDRKDLDILKESIKNVGILVPLLVYEELKTKKIIILDGARRYRCVKELCAKFPKEKNKWEKMPVNIISEPTMTDNILRMFNIHNVRKAWELMPTAIKLEVLIKKLNEKNDEKLAELTGLTVTNVRRCKILLSFSEKIRNEMMIINPDDRVKPDFFLEMWPLLNLIEKNLPQFSKKMSRNEIIEIFLEKYKKREMTNILHFRYLSDIIRNYKKGYFELKEVQDGFEELLSTKLSVKEFLSGFKKDVKGTETFGKSVEKISFNIKKYNPQTSEEASIILKKLFKLKDALDKKIKILESFDLKEN